MADPKKPGMSRQDLKKTVPVLDEFNKFSQAFIKMLGQKVETKRKKVHTLSIMVSGIKIPDRYANSTLNIQTVDINDTRISRKGDGGYKQKMDWETDYQKRKRGFIL
jgi:hypothetical protein